MFDRVLADAHGPPTVAKPKPIHSRTPTINAQLLVHDHHSNPRPPTINTMVLRLRLARIATPGGARRHAPIYNIVLAHARTARDSLPLEVLGTYNPIPSLPAGFSEKDVEEGKVRKQKDIKVDVARAKYWLGVGAQPSGTVWRLLSLVSCNLFCAGA